MKKMRSKKWKAHREKRLPYLVQPGQDELLGNTLLWRVSTIHLFARPARHQATSLQTHVGVPSKADCIDGFLRKPTAFGSVLRYRDVPLRGPV